MSSMSYCSCSKKETVSAQQSRGGGGQGWKAAVQHAAQRLQQLAWPPYHLAHSLTYCGCLRSGKQQSVHD
jgi:hypothetical protein